MEKFIGGLFLCVVVISVAVKWMAADYAKAHPEDAEAIKKAASSKLASVIKKRLE